MLVDEIQKANSIVVLGHKHPDGDALGAVLAMGHFIRNEFGKTPVLAHEGVIPDNLRFLTNGWWLKKAEEIKSQAFDLMILIDAADINKQLGDDGRVIFANARYKIKIDHHSDSVPQADENIIEYVAATSEIIEKISRENGWRITPQIACYLYTGIYTDTGGFVHDYTTCATMTAAARMIEFGADPTMIARRIAEKTKQTFLNNVETLARTGFTEDDRIGYFTYSVKRTAGERPHRESSWLHQQVLTIKDVEASVAIKELDDNTLTVGVRSKGKTISTFCKEYGGGGHLHAAAFAFSGSMDEVICEILPKLSEHLARDEKYKKKDNKKKKNKNKNADNGGGDNAKDNNVADDGNRPAPRDTSPNEPISV